MYLRTNEEGQGLIEFALVLPLFFAICFGIMDLCWFGYNVLEFDSHYATDTRRVVNLYSSSVSGKIFENNYYVTHADFDPKYGYGPEFDAAVRNTYIKADSYKFGDRKIFNKNNLIVEGANAVVTFQDCKPFIIRDKNYEYHHGLNIEKYTHVELQATIKYKFNPLTPFSKVVLPMLMEGDQFVIKRNANLACTGYKTKRTNPYAEQMADNTYGDGYYADIYDLQGQ